MVCSQQLYTNCAGVRTGHVHDHEVNAGRDELLRMLSRHRVKHRAI